MNSAPGMGHAVGLGGLAGCARLPKREVGPIWASFGELAAGTVTNDPSIQREKTFRFDNRIAVKKNTLPEKFALNNCCLRLL
jgi:hypothetical protein